MKNQANKNYPDLAKQLTNKKTKSLHKFFFLSPSKIRRSEGIAKKNYDK